MKKGKSTSLEDIKELKFWTPSVRLRWKWRENALIPEKLLQQKWISDKGDIEWRDVPIEE